MRFNHVRRLFITSLSSAVLLTGLTRCAADKTSVESAAPVKAASLITESFGTTNDVKTGTPALVIRKDALEKEFLIQSALIPQTVAAMGQSMRSRIVAFKRNGNQLLLVEATAGHTVTNDLPQNLVLTTFPILAENSTAIDFDFNAGMSVIFATGEWAAQDSGGRDYSPDFKFAKVRVSYLDNVRFVAPNQLAIRQIAQVAVSGLMGESVLPIEVRYFLSPYRPNPAFVPSPDADFKRVGFFEVSPRLRLDGSTEIHSTKFDVKAPIVFAVSSNTPADYRQAVRDGILYWKAELPNVEAIDAPSGATAPDIQNNIIQWVNHDRAGMAYADAQMDPRTGEVLHAQAFITSTFAFSGRNQVRRLLRRLEEPSKPSRGKFALAGFEMPGLCDFEVRESLQRSLGELISVKASDSTILRVSQDYVRAVVAHEVGHLLGLRHNFAGSLAAKHYPLAKREEIFQEYLEHDRVDTNIETTSSEMDYMPMEESAIHGYQIRTLRGRLAPYDRIAIAMLYKGANPSEEEVPPFCTDSGVSKYTDCRRHDAGTSLVEFATTSSKKALDTLANRILEAFISVKSPEPWEKARTVASVNIDPEKIASSLFAPLDDLLTAVGSEKHSILSTREFAYIGPLNKDIVQKKELDAFQAEVRRIGGWGNLLSTPSAKDFEKMFTSTEDLLRDPAYREGRGLGGQAYTFSTKETDEMLNTVLNLAVKLPDAAAKADINTLKKIPDRWKISGTETGDELAKLIFKRVNHYVMTLYAAPYVEVEIEVPVASPGILSSIADALSAPKSLGEAGLELGKKDPAKLSPLGNAPVKTAAAAPKTRKQVVKLPQFKFSQEAREKAPLLLSKGKDPDGILWGATERTALKAEFKKLLDTSCGCDFSSTTVEKLGITDAQNRKKVARWFQENKAVLMSFPL